MTVIFAVYAGGVIAALLLFGNLSDSIGRRRALLPGLALSAASAVIFLLADGLPLLLVGRVLSGLSAGIFTGTATATLVDLGAGRERRNGRRSSQRSSTSAASASGRSWPGCSPNTRPTRSRSSSSSTWSCCCPPPWGSG